MTGELSPSGVAPDSALFDSLNRGSIDGQAVRFESDNALEQVAELSGKGVQFQTLNISQPDLESVFLTLTGRSLRD